MTRVQSIPRQASIGVLVVALALLTCAAVALAAQPVRGSTYSGKTSQSAKATGLGNTIRLRVASDGRHLGFAGVTNVVGDRCVDTISDPAAARKGLGHPAPSIVIRRNGTFAGSHTMLGKGFKLRTRIDGRFTGSGRTARGAITESQPPNAHLPAGCHIHVTFRVRAR